ncbi:MAG: mechanosensitive ion channel family protein [Gemmatimonadales bacterium]
MPLYTIREVVQAVLAFLRLDAADLGRKAVQLGFIALFAYGAMRLVKLVARRIERAVDDGGDSTFTEREQRGHTISHLLRGVGRVTIVGVALLLAFNVFVNIGPLLAGAGILGLAVSFGAQSLVKDVIAGFFILMENQFAMGDVIEVAGKSGVVERMTLRMVMLRDTDGTVHMVPNGHITTVSNQTRKWSNAVLDVGIAYESDIDRVLGVLRDEARDFATDPLWGPRLDGAPEVQGVQNLGDSAVTVRTVLQTQPGAQWEVAREFRRRLKNRLDAEGIEIPYPQRTLHLKPAESPAADTISARPPGA